MKLLLSFYFMFFSMTFSSTDRDDYTKEKTLSLSAGNISKFEINCGSGSLEIRGDKRAEKIEVSATIKVRNAPRNRAEELIKEDLELTLEKKGKRAVLISKFHRSSFFRRNTQISVDLVVTIPKELDLDIDDGSGSIEIRDIDGDIYIDDGSGGLKIRNIRGNVEINDGSGGLDIYNIEGDVEVDDNSGSIDIRDIDGSVIVSDGSGSINISGVGKNVTIRDDGSGGVRIRNVRGDIRRRDR